MIARTAKTLRLSLSRSFTASSRRLAGDHHPHTVFDDKTFTRKNVGGFVWTFVVGGTRSFTASARRLAGDHHPHTVFHDKSFTRKNVGGFVWTFVIGGTVATLGICHNWIRSFTASARRLAGDNHPHTVFHDKSFTRKNVGGFVWTFVIGGTVATLGICQFQNYKGGFPQQK
ncbi:hypothetical protein ACHHYP_06997 [Achlya hypogyna]|uniref:Uncharacterized protein n=1 Tax=Achlya hypogyna TaxID=1202772 RepID=A0A1V9YR80_ACHHY|nr:hypothetical protein ACHHYP_06997 [Achlya hypogyna]